MMTIWPCAAFARGASFASPAKLTVAIPPLTTRAATTPATRNLRTDMLHPPFGEHARDAPRTGRLTPGAGVATGSGWLPADGQMGAGGHPRAAPRPPQPGQA